MHITRKFLTLLFISLLLLPLAGCFNLGDGYTKTDPIEEEEQPYYDAYGDVILVDNVSHLDSYDISDFYNKGSVKNYDCVLTESKEYTYIGIEIDKDLKLGEVAVYFNANVTAEARVSFFVVNEMPDEIYYIDSFGKPCNFIDNDEPDDDSKVGQVSARLTENKWTSIFLKKWNTEGRLEVSSGQILLIKIENNCYDKYQKTLENSKSEMNEANKTYLEDLKDYKQKESSESYSQEEKAEAKAKMENSLALYNEALKAYEKAKEEYEKNKSPYTTRISVKITDILIYAE